MPGGLCEPPRPVAHQKLRLTGDQCRSTMITAKTSDGEPPEAPSFVREPTSTAPPSANGRVHLREAAPCPADPAQHRSAFCHVHRVVALPEMPPDLFIVGIPNAAPRPCTSIWRHIPRSTWPRRRCTLSARTCASAPSFIGAPCRNTSRSLKGAIANPMPARHPCGISFPRKPPPRSTPSTRRRALLSCSVSRPTCSTRYITSSALMATSTCRHLRRRWPPSQSAGSGGVSVGRRNSRRAWSIATPFATLSRSGATSMSLPRPGARHRL